MIKLSQRGQSMIEFSIIFPFFMLLILSLTYFGLAFADYLQLNNIARSSARETVMSINIADDGTKTNAQINNDIKGKIDVIKQKYYKQKLISNMYYWDDRHGQYNIRYDKDNKNFIVTIEAPLNNDSDSLSSVIDRLANHKLSEKGTFDIKIEYTMYKG